MSNENTFAQKVSKGDVTKADAKIYLNYGTTNLPLVVDLLKEALLTDRTINTIILDRLGKLISTCEYIVKDPTATEKQKDQAIEILAGVAQTMNKIRSGSKLIVILTITGALLLIAQLIIIEMLKGRKSK